MENEILGIELILCSGLPAETRGKDCRNVATTTGRIGQRTKSDGWRTNTIRSYIFLLSLSVLSATVSYSNSRLLRIIAPLLPFLHSSPPTSVRIVVWSFLVLDIPQCLFRSVS